MAITPNRNSIHAAGSGTAFKACMALGLPRVVLPYSMREVNCYCSKQKRIVFMVSFLQIKCDRMVFGSVIDASASPPL